MGLWQHLPEEALIVNNVNSVMLHIGRHPHAPRPLHSATGHSSLGHSLLRRHVRNASRQRRSSTSYRSPARSSLDSCNISSASSIGSEYSVMSLKGACVDCSVCVAGTDEPLCCASASWRAGRHHGVQLAGGLLEGGRLQKRLVHHVRVRQRRKAHGLLSWSIEHTPYFEPRSGSNLGDRTRSRSSSRTARWSPPSCR